MSDGPSHIGAALAALGARPKVASQPWTNKQLLAWAPELGTVDNVGITLHTLRERGLVRQVKSGESEGRAAWRSAQPYLLTPAGAVAAEAAHTAQTGRARARPMVNSRPAAGMPGRVWSLLRMRRMLTPREAAETLVDAGDPDALARAQVQAGRWLRAWAAAHPQVLQVSRVRSAGSLRYVLIADIGQAPPKVTLRPGRTKRKAVA